MNTFVLPMGNQRIEKVKSYLTKYYMLDLVDENSDSITLGNKRMIVNIGKEWINIWLFDIETNIDKIQKLLGDR